MKLAYDNTKGDPNFFSYAEGGFYFKQMPESFFYNWDDIEAIFGYKRDLITTDEVYLDIFFKYGKTLNVGESTPGWFVFTEKILEEFPSITKDVISNLSQPPFQTNHTLLFDDKNRSFEEAVTQLYKK